MNLRPYTTYLNIAGHCAMCMLPGVAFRSTSSTSNMPSSPWSRLRLSGVVRNYSSSMSSARVSSAQIKIASPSQMEQAGAFFGADTEVGETVLLHGDLGTGKTCFARGFVRARIGNPCLAVTSPSYLLDNTYKVEDEDITLHHMDLYRLQGGADLRVLDIPGVLETSVCLIEWPDRLGAARPENRLDVHLKAASEDERTVTFTGHGTWWAGVVDDFRERQKRTAIL